MPRRTAEEKLYERQLEEEMLSNIYLPFAKLEFESDDWSNDWLSVGMTSAQGWRAHQEDAHVCELEFDQNSALFAVFDGHNGPEVARYAAEKLPQHIKLRQSNKTDYGKLFQFGETSNQVEAIFTQFKCLRKVSWSLMRVCWRRRPMNGCTRFAASTSWRMGLFADTGYRT